MLDLISSIMLASSLGVGVLLSSMYYWLYVNSWGRDKTNGEDHKPDGLCEKIPPAVSGRGENAL